jgi:putative transposase
MGRWFYLYLILDLFSRKIVGWEVHETDDSHHAANVVRRTALAEKIALMDNKPKLHGDNGATLKAMTVLSMLHWLSIEPSYSRPRVSDDNAYVESLFRTAKYRPEFPAKGFASLEVTRRWADQFVHWYNYEHKHSGIGYVSPAQKHCGQDIAILAARDVVYAEAKRLNPSRWSGATRDWTPIEVVTLNPEKEAVISAHLKGQQSSGREASNNLLHAA